MEIEDQLVSFDLAREMEELGVKRDSLWVWMKPPRTGLPEVVLRKTMILLEDQGWLYFSAAPTVAELGEMLPPSTYTICLTISKEVWLCDSGLLYPRGQAKKEADARAKMLIYLIKEGYVKVEDLK